MYLINYFIIMSYEDDNYSNSSDDDVKGDIGKMSSKMFLKTSNNLSQYESENNELKKDVFNFKIILLGDIAVGKTSILSRFCTNSFNSDYKCSIGVEFKVKSLHVDQSTIADLKIWDTCGDEKFRAVTRQYYKESKGVILVFDLTNRESFKKLDFWIEDVRVNSPEEASIVLIGNKSDLVDQRKVTQKEIAEYAKKKKLEFLEVSAKTGSNISLLFENLSTTLIKIEKERLLIDTGEKKELSNSTVLKKESLLKVKKEEKKGKDIKCC